MVTLSLIKEARIYNGEKTTSSISGAGKTGPTCKRMKLEYFLRPYTKINYEWIKDLNVRSDTVKLLEENIGRALFDINHSKILFDPPPGEMAIKTKIKKWDLMKLKSFCTAKDTINKTKRQPSVLCITQRWSLTVLAHQ